MNMQVLVTLEVIGDIYAGKSIVDLTNDSVNVNNTGWYANEDSIDDTIAWYKDEGLTVNIIKDLRK